MKSIAKTLLYFILFFSHIASMASPSDSVKAENTVMQKPSSINLIYPLSLKEEVPPVVTLDWNSADGDNGQKYRLQLFDKEGILTEERLVDQHWTQLDGLAKGSPYYWRVRAESPARVGEWSQFGSFTSSTLDTILTIEEVNAEIPLEGKIPLLLIHGWNQAGKPAPPTGGMWANIKDFVKNDPDLSSHFKLYMVKYWSNAVSVNELAAKMSRSMEAMGLHERKVVLMAHSMGGLVSKSYMNEQTFQTGRYSGQKCGNQVKLLITLGTPHHGSPMANGPARDAKVSFLNKIYMAIVESIAFSNVKYNEVNRGDMRWDNYNNLYDYTKYSDEKNDWLVGINSDTTFDRKIICYAATITGKFYLSPSGTEQNYQMGAYMQEGSIGYKNDGIVPYISGTFDGHHVRKVHYYKEYNHADINTGKPNDSALVDSLKIDLLPFLPLTVEKPAHLPIFLKGGSVYNIQWKAPADIETVDIHFSADNGVSYSQIANDVVAANGQFSWLVPEINSGNCIIRVENSADPFEFALSEVPFTVYHNELIVKTPSSDHHVVWKRDNLINWTQTGLGNKLNIIYVDNKNGVEKKIAHEQTFISGDNSFSWKIDNFFLPTDSAQLRFELTGMAELYGDTTKYIWYSDYFTLFGDSKISVSFPHTETPDEFGIVGKKLQIGSKNQLEWEAEGEIGFLSFYLCDSLKNKIKLFGQKTIEPKLQSKGTFSWEAPEVFGDKFWLLIEGGPDQASVNTQAYNAFPFRINRSPRLISPSNENNMLKVLPCFELSPSEQASQYEFVVKNGSEILNIYKTENPKFNVANKIENELEPNGSYQLYVWEHYGANRSYGLIQPFKVLPEGPQPFAAIKPVTGAFLNDSLVTISWNRSVGADHYQLEIINQNDTLAVYNQLTRTDTTAIANLGDEWHRDSIFVTITSFNNFGQFQTQSYFFNSFKEDKAIFNNSKGSSFSLYNYPNPFDLKTNIVFDLPESKVNQKTSLTVYNMNGQKIETLVDRPLESGRHQIEWEPGNRSPKRTISGLYFLQLVSGDLVETICISVK